MVDVRCTVRASLLPTLAVTGLAAGVAAGTTNAMVAVLIIHFFSLGTVRNVMAPAMNACLMFGKAAQILVLAPAGQVSINSCWKGDHWPSLLLGRFNSDSGHKPVWPPKTINGC